MNLGAKGRFIRNRRLSLSAHNQSYQARLTQSLQGRVLRCVLRTQTFDFTIGTFPITTLQSLKRFAYICPSFLLWIRPKRPINIDIQGKNYGFICDPQVYRRNNRFFLERAAYEKGLSFSLDRVFSGMGAESDLYYILMDLICRVG